MSEPLTIGLIGFGYWARLAYVPLLAEISGVTVTSVAARSEASRSAAVDVLGKDIGLFDSYSALIKAGGVDAVMVALTPQLNSTAAAAALERGLHVFVEPPFASGEATERMLALAGDGAGPMVLHADVEPRYLPVVQALRSLFGPREEFGILRSVRLDLEMLLSPEYRETSMVFGLGPWYVDLIDAMVDSPAREREMRLVRGNVREDGLLVTGRAEIGYESGARATWQFSFEGPRELALRLRLTGEGGEAEADLTTGEYRWRRHGGEWRTATADCSRPEAGFIGMRESVRAFIAAVRGEGATLSGPDVIHRTQPVLLELARLEAASGR